MIRGSYVQIFYLFSTAYLKAAKRKKDPKNPNAKKKKR